MPYINLLSLDKKLSNQNIGYYNQSIDKSKLDKFKSTLAEFIKAINDLANDKQQREESLKLKIRDLLIGNFYSNDQIDIKGNIDLAILNKDHLTNKVDVIFELKTPKLKPETNKEMISTNNINTKAMWELVHYYMQERLKGNITIKHLIATNGFEWFVFDAREFEKLFFENKDFKKKYLDWHNNVTVNKNAPMAYEIISKSIELLEDEINVVHFSIEDISGDDEIIKLYKLLSPQHLLKLPFANDSNTLNTEFYNELLYILGLEERKDNGRNIISRDLPSNRQSASLIENTINQLKINKNFSDEESIFEIALELCITWLNRILFLKLLEGQLIKFHNNDKLDYSFMNIEKIKEFDDLNELFFEVLAVPEKDRSDDVKEKYKNIPYLNSSLFELTDYEKQYITINSLKDRLHLKLYKATVLKEPKENLTTLNYLFAFLNAYDFSSDSSAKVQKDNRNIINAAVLGLIFEKINGYKDGSFFTPGYITEYMCRETIRQAVIDKFNEKYNWQCRNFIDLYNKIDEKHTDEANAVIDSLRICDPAVGSGHFLVSALNEIIAIKSELEILADDNGKRLKDVKIKVENDELVILYKNKFFEYKPGDDDSQRVQETIFKEKQKIIENCLFGVDINSKSVQITRLRLWIELLKNAYYKAPDYKELETLPNIDINIKCGDSLISRFNLKDDTQNFSPNERKKIRLIINEYKEKVKLYKCASDKITRHKIQDDIAKLKEKISEVSDPKDPDFKKLREKKNQLEETRSNIPIAFDETYKNEWKINLDRLVSEVQEQQAIYDEKQNTIYSKAFEWRFEFPEVLDDNGDYVGFDSVIGNPPYIQLQNAFNEKMKYADLYKNMGYETFDRTGDIYCLFYEKGIEIAKDNGLLCYISSNKWMRAGYGEKLRKFFIKYKPLLLIDLGPGIFESATVDTCIMMLQKAKNKGGYSLRAVTIEKDKNLPISIEQQVKDKAVTLTKLSQNAWFIADDAEQKLKEKIESIGKPLKDWDVKIYRGILTGLNEAFVIDDAKRREILDNCKDDAERERTAAIIKPILRGRDIKRYYYQWAGLWVIIIPAGWTNKNIGNEKPEIFIEKTYPSLMNYLKNFENKAKKRDDQGDYWWELRSCSYYEEFEKEKIVWQELAQGTQFTLDTKGEFFISNTGYILTGNNLKYLTAYLNSKLNEFSYKMWYCTKLGSSGIRWLNQHVINIPIPPITSSNEQLVSQIEQLVDKILSAKKTDPNADTTDLERQIDELVYKLYDLTPAEIEVVEMKV